MGSWPSVKVRLGTLNSSDMTSSYSVPSTREVVLCRDLGVSSSIQAHRTGRRSRESDRYNLMVANLRVTKRGTYERCADLVEDNVQLTLSRFSII